jgi:hypothetical protein
MKDYTDFPPCKYFVRVLKSCPTSALLYVQLWNKVSQENMALKLSKKDIRKDYLISPTMFRNLLARLMFLNLVSYVEKDDKFHIDIMMGHNPNE